MKKKKGEKKKNGHFYFQVGIHSSKGQGKKGAE